MANIEQIIKDAGLIHKGQIENVVMFEHPEHPGVTMSSKLEDITDVPALKALAESKLKAHLEGGGRSLEQIRKKLGLSSEMGDDVARIMQRRASRQPKSSRIFLDTETYNTNRVAYTEGNMAEAFRNDQIIQLHTSGMTHEGFIRPPLTPAGAYKVDLQSAFSQNVITTAQQAGQTRMLPTEDAALYQFYRNIESKMAEGPTTISGWNVKYDIDAISARTNQYSTLSSYKGFFDSNVASGKLKISGAEETLFNHVWNSAQADPDFMAHLQGKTNTPLLAAANLRDVEGWNQANVAKAAGLGEELHFAHTDVAQMGELVSKVEKNDLPTDFLSKVYGNWSKASGAVEAIEQAPKSRGLVRDAASLIFRNRRNLGIGIGIAAIAAVAGKLAFGKREDRQTQLEGLHHGGMAGGRRSDTDFGSGYRGIAAGMKRAAKRNLPLVESVFSLRRYAREIEGIYETLPLEEMSHGKEISNPLYSAIVRPRIRPSRREALVIAKNIKPYMGNAKLKFLKKGAESDVWELGKGHVFKLSQPVYEPVDLSKVETVLQPNYRQRFAKYEASVYPRVKQLPEDDLWGHVEAMTNIRKDLTKHGLFWLDPAERNVGFIGKKGYIIDPGHIVPLDNLAPGREATIEGLRHGSASSSMRHKLTDFGSGWRGTIEAIKTGGIASLTPYQFAPLGVTNTGSMMLQHGSAVRGITFLASRNISERGIQRYYNVLAKSGETAGVSSNEFINSIKHIRSMGLQKDMAGAYSQLRSVNRWSKLTGLNPIVLNVNMARALNPSPMYLAELINHEQIHSTQLSSLEHSFFRQAEGEAGTLESAVSKVHRGPMLADFYESSEAARSAGADVALKYRRQISMLQKSPETSLMADFVERSEPVAHFFQSDQGFLARAEQAGIKTPGSVTAEMEGVVSKWIASAAHTAPGRSKSLIEGLSSKGFGRIMRKALAAFGSGWQGLDSDLKVFHEITGPKEYIATLMKGEETMGFMSYSIKPGGVLQQGSMAMFDAYKGQGHGKGLLTEIMREGQKKGAITFRSDPAGLSDEMVHVFQSGQRKGIMEAFADQGKTAYKANLFNLEKNIMKSGEGMAIVKAGTAEIPSVLRAGARIIKSAL